MRRQRSVRQHAPVAEPLKPSLTPVPVEPIPPPAVTAGEPEPAPRSHVNSIVLGVAAVAAAGIAAGFGAGALSARGQVLQSMDGRSTLRGSEAQALANTANTQGAVAGGAAILAAGLGVTAVVLW